MEIAALTRSAGKKVCHTSGMLRAGSCAATRAVGFNGSRQRTWYYRSWKNYSWGGKDLSGVLANLVVRFRPARSEMTSRSRTFLPDDMSTGFRRCGVDQEPRGDDGYGATPNCRRCAQPGSRLLGSRSQRVMIVHSIGGTRTGRP